MPQDARELMGAVKAHTWVACMQVIYLFMSSTMLVDMKRKELRYKARQRARQERAAAPAAEGKKTCMLPCVLICKVRGTEDIQSPRRYQLITSKLLCACVLSGTGPL